MMGSRRVRPYWLSRHVSTGWKGIDANGHSEMGQDRLRFSTCR